MTLIERVTQLVGEADLPCTVDDLYPLLSRDGYTRHQVLKALANAAYTGKILSVAERRHGPNGCVLPAIYEPLTPKPMRVCRARASSVWDYARQVAA